MKVNQMKVNQIKVNQMKVNRFVSDGHQRLFFNGIQNTKV